MASIVTRKNIRQNNEKNDPLWRMRHEEAFADGYMTEWGFSHLARHLFIRFMSMGLER